MSRGKEIHSDKYGKPATWSNGLHNILHKRKKGYKKSQLWRYVKGFNEYIGKPKKKDSVALVQNNFDKWLEYIESID